MPTGSSACTPPSAAGTPRCATASTACTARRAARATSTACARSFSARRSSCPAPRRACSSPAGAGTWAAISTSSRPRACQPAAGEAQAERFAAEPVPAGTVIREQGELGDTVVIPIPQRDRFHGVLIAAGRRGGFAEHDDAVLVALGEHLGAILQAERLNAELRESYVGALHMLAEAIDAKDPRAARALRGGRALRRGDGTAAGGRAGRAAAAVARVAPARRRHRRGVRTRPAQAGPAERPGARGRGGAPADRRAGRRAGSRAAPAGARDPPSPRALRRHRLSQRPRGRRDPRPRHGSSRSPTPSAR